MAVDTVEDVTYAVLRNRCFIHPGWEMKMAPTAMYRQYIFSIVTQLIDMVGRRTRTIIGLAMITLGLIQVGSFAVQSNWIFSFLGLIYAILGVVYLWAEVYSTAQ